MNNNNGTYIAEIRKCSNELMRISVKQKCFQFRLERVQRYVYRPQIVRQAVPHSWSTAGGSFNGEHMYNVIITKIALVRSTFSAKKNSQCLLAAGLRPDPLTSLSAPADSLAVGGRRCGNKGRRREKARERRERKAAHPRSFL